MEAEKEKESEISVDVVEGFSDEDDGGEEFDEEEVFVKALAMTVKYIIYSMIFNLNDIIFSSTSG